LSLPVVLQNNPNNQRGSDQSGYGIDGQTVVEYGRLCNQVAGYQQYGTAEHDGRQQNGMIPSFEQPPGNVRCCNTYKGDGACESRYTAR